MIKTIRIIETIVIYTAGAFLMTAWIFEKI